MATYLPFSDVVAAYGYKQPQPESPRINLLLLAFAYVIMGGAMGTVAGTGLAMATVHTTTSLPTMTFSPPVQASTTVDRPIVFQADASTLTVQTVDLPLSEQTIAPHKSTKTNYEFNHHQHAVQHATVMLNQAALPMLPAYVAPSYANQPASPLSSAVVDAGAQSSIFFSEGDATIADFDASSGTIETYEGRTFVLNASTISAVNDLFQDSGASVHYRCDQSNTCTLSQDGQVMQNVRLM